MRESCQTSHRDRSQGGAFAILKLCELFRRSVRYYRSGSMEQSGGMGRGGNGIGKDEILTETFLEGNDS
jgi:hypothetical protein